MTLSYEDTKAEVLDCLFTHLIQNTNNEQALKESLAYLIYDFESNYPPIERLLINFCIFVLAEKLYKDAQISQLLKSDIFQSIPFNLRSLINQLNDEDKVNFLEDFYLTGFITQQQRDDLA